LLSLEHVAAKVRREPVADVGAERSVFPDASGILFSIEHSDCSKHSDVNTKCMNVGIGALMRPKTNAF
jgi:hypothetical protein